MHPAKSLCRDVCCRPPTRRCAAAPGIDRRFFSLEISDRSRGCFAGSAFRIR